MGKYSKEHNDFFNAITDLGEDVERAKNNPLLRDVIRVPKTVNDPSVIPYDISYEIMKTASANIPEDINPIKLKNFLIDNYKTDWIDWVPEVTNKTIFGDQKSEILFNKIQAIGVCLSTDTPWLEWHIFENVGKSFNHQIPEFSYIQPLTVGECATTMDTMMKLRSEEEFSKEVLAYIGSVAANNGFVYLPEDLHVGLAQPILNGFVFDSKLTLKTKAAWDRLKDKSVLNAEFSEDDPIHRQLAKLALVQQYCREFQE